MKRGKKRGRGGWERERWFRVVTCEDIFKFIIYPVTVYKNYAATSYSEESYNSNLKLNLFNININLYKNFIILLLIYFFLLYLILKILFFLIRN